jgi:acetoin utilization deacetylase AcuC-like enzyme
MRDGCVRVLAAATALPTRACQPPPPRRARPDPPRAVNAGHAGHAAALAAFSAIIEPAARRFRPDIILVSAGYDGHVLDPFQLLQYESRTYHALAAGLQRMARELCGGRVVFLLEGGYDGAALGESVVETWRALLGLPSADGAPAAPPQPEPSDAVAALLQELRAIHNL